MGSAVFNMDIFEQYENLEKSGMSAPIAHAVKDFVLATQKAGDFATKADLREHKAERLNDLQTFEVNVDRKLDQIRHEIKETRQELKSEIDSKINNLKVDLIRWMAGLFFTQTALLASVVIGLKVFGG